MVDGEGLRSRFAWERRGRGRGRRRRREEMNAMMRRRDWEKKT